MVTRRLLSLLLSLLVVGSLLPVQTAPVLAADGSQAGTPSSVGGNEIEAAPATDPAVPDEPTDSDDPARATLFDGAPPSAAGPPSGVDADGPAISLEVLSALDRAPRVPVIIRLRDQLDAEALNADARAIGRERGEAARGRHVVDALREHAAATQGAVLALLRAEQRAGRAGSVRSFWVFNGFAATVSRAALDRLASHDDVASVTLDEEITLPETESVPRLPTWGLEKVFAPTVWGDYGFSGEGVVIGIMDSGADGGHPAISGRYRGRDGDDAHSWFAATGENYPTPSDGHGHGTHVTGTIVGGAPGDITGVAPDAEWIMAKIFRDSGSTSTSIIHAGFEWMLAPGGDPAMAPDLVSNSWGSAATYSIEFLPDVQAWLAAGIFPLFAAGNDGPGPETIGSPGSFLESFAVGATDINDLVAGFSSRGPVIWDGVEYLKPDLSAPGVQIYSTWPRNLDPDGYNTISGTSMATPHVAGVIALLLSAEPDLTVEELRQLLTVTARSEPQMGTLPNVAYGAGIVNAEAAILAARFSGTLSGTISGPDGPVPATVAIPELGLSTIADAAGAYELIVREGTWQVEVSAYGHVTQTSAIVIAADEELTRDFALVAAATHTVTGTVTSGGSPLSGAVVRAHGAPIEAAYTSGDGTFSFQIAAGSYVISADATGYRRATQEVVVAGDLSLAFELAALGGTTQAGWTQFQNNPARTGVSPEGLAGAALEPAWEGEVPGTPFFSSPVVGDDTVYLTTDQGGVHALDLDSGELQWSFATANGQRSTPAVAGGLVYVGGGVSGFFYALDADTGEPAWSYPTGDFLTYATPTVVEGTVYFGTGFTEGNGGWVYALDAATGELTWRTFVGAQLFFAPAIHGGLVYAASFDARRLVALDASTGALVWELTRGADTFLSMPTVDDGRVFAATSGLDEVSGSLLSLDAATGALLWEQPQHGDGAGNAPVAFDDLVIAGSTVNNWVRAYDRGTGAVRWVAPIGSAVSNSQLAADGVVVGGSQQDHRAWALDAYTGDLLWEATVDDNVLSAPALSDGRLLVADRSGAVHAFEAPGTVSGVVTDQDGTPLAATLRLAGTDEETATDPASGTFTLSARAGDYTLEARSYGYLLASAAVTLRSGQSAVQDFAMLSAGTGSLNGVVRDEQGGALQGVEIRLPATPLEPASTAPDGSFSFPAVAEGSYALEATLGGYATLAAQVTIAADQATTVELILERFQIAVTGDHDGAVSEYLAAQGYRTEATTAAAIADRPGDYELIVANASQDDPGEAAFEQLVAAADAAETSVIFVDTWGLSYGSIEQLRKYLGDPAQTGSGYNDGEVSLIARAEHPLTAGLPIGERVPILAPDTEYAWFAGYGGRSLADVYLGDAGRTVGSGIGVEARTMDSVHVLLSLHGASPWSGPTTTWQAAGRQVFLNAVAYALSAEFGTVSGTITDAATGTGLPATVTSLDSGDRATADASGAYALLLPPGDHTLRIERIGFTPQEVGVSVAAGDTATVDAQLVSSGLGGIAGVVTDAATGTPLSGATITVLDTGIPPVTSGVDGSYAIEAIPGGTYRVEFREGSHRTRIMEDVVVVDGSVTELNAALEARLRVAVIGDDGTHLSTFLNVNEVGATPTGWDALDQLADFDVLIAHNPTDPGEAAFLGYLDTIDAAGISVIWVEGATSTTGGNRLLRKYLGEPSARDFVSNDGQPLFTAVDPSHPLFEGLPSPVQVLANDEWGGFYTGYSGIKLADFGTNELGILGIGAAYEPRTPSSVRLLLSALSSSSLARPTAGWTPEGQRLFLNAVAWAADPDLASLAGRVTDADGDPLAAHVEITSTGFGTDTDAEGTYALGHPAGDMTVEVSAFGYVTQSHDVSLSAGEVTELNVELALDAVGSIAGVVTSRPDLSPQADDGEPLAGASVTLVGHPRSATTAADGSYALPNIPPGTYEIEVQATDHVRQIFDGIGVVAGQVTTTDVAIRPSPRVGVIDDCSQSTDCSGKLKAYLAEWGYLAEDLAWTDTDGLADLDLIFANLGDFPREDPGAAGLAAFQDAANRAHVPVIWADAFQRGAIRYLVDYEGDPMSRSEARTRGVVSARILADHPLVEGFDVGEVVPIIENNGEHTWFGGYSGTSVANLVTSSGEVGSAIAYRGRTASSADVLLASLGVSFYTWPAVGGEPAELFTPQAERLIQNALNYALDAPPLAAEVLGAVRSDGGQLIASNVRVLETGRTYPGRAGDGTFLVPLQPGSWTLEVSAFGHASALLDVTVVAGDTLRPAITLVSDPVGSVAGSVSDETGAALPGVSVEVEGTPLTASTDVDGAYHIDGAPAGEYSVLFRLAGRAQVRLPVTIAAGQTSQLDAVLPPSQVVAVAGDHLGSIAAFLEAHGYTVQAWSWADIDDHVGQLGDVALVILNGAGTAPDAGEFTNFMDAAAQAEVSVLLAGQFGMGSIRRSSDYRGDPQDYTQDFTGGPIYYRPTVEHPIFDGFAIGEPIELMHHPTQTNQQFEFFTGYSGATIAHLNAPTEGGDMGGGVGYRFSSPTSVEVLLDSLGATIYGYPGQFPGVRWSPAAEQIYLNAVAWAITASQGEISGSVTSGAEPVAGATVTAMEAGISTTSASDGSYRLGVPDGTHTVRVEALGYEPFETTVTVAESEEVVLDVNLVRLPRGAIAGNVTDPDGIPIAGAVIGLAGPMEGEAITDVTGAFALDDLLPGDYELHVAANGFLPVDVETSVTAGAITELSIELTPNNVAVLGDVDAVLVDFLRAHDVAAEEVDWALPVEAVERFDVLVVNGGEPGEEEFDGLLAAAAEAEASVVFTGTWGVEEGGIRLLEQFAPEAVSVGGQGYRDGAVSITGFDPEHPLFAGLDDPSQPVADDGYYSFLDDYIGISLGQVTVEAREAGAPLGIGAAYDFTSDGGVHLLLSASAASDFIGPGYGWTDDGEALFLNAVAWAATVEQPLPAAPTLSTTADPIGTAPTITLDGTAEYRTTVSILRAGEVIGTATPDRDGTFSLEVGLIEGPNAFTAVAANYAGDSPPSAAVVVTLDTTAPEIGWVTPADGDGSFSAAITVAGQATDTHAGVATVLVNGVAADLESGGSWSAPLELDMGVNAITVEAIDALGNSVSETREVRLFPYSTSWQVAGERGKGAVIGFVQVLDQAGLPLQVDAAILDAWRDGVLVASTAMVWDAAEDRYVGNLGALARGTYVLRARLVVEGWNVTEEGPTIRRR